MPGANHDVGKYFVLNIHYSNDPGLRNMGLGNKKAFLNGAIPACSV